MRTSSIVIFHNYNRMASVSYNISNTSETISSEYPIPRGELETQRIGYEIRAAGYLALVV